MHQVELLQKPPENLSRCFLFSTPEMHCLAALSINVITSVLFPVTQPYILYVLAISLYLTHLIYLLIKQFVHLPSYCTSQIEIYVSPLRYAAALRRM